MDKRHIEYIKKNTRFLTELGFTSEVVSKKLTDELSTKFIRFKNTAIRIDISYSHFVDAKSINLTIGLLSKNASFSFEEYLLFKGKNKDSCVGGVNEDDEEYIKRFFILFQELVDEELHEVLKGRKWIEVPKDYSRIR